MGKTQRRSAPVIARGRFDIALIAILAAAFALRLTFVLQLRQSPFFEHLFSDSQLYDRISDAILRGSPGGAAWFMSPLYPYLLAAVKSVTGDFALWTRVLQCLLGTGTVAFIHVATRDLAGRRAALAAAVLAAVYPAFVFYDGQILFDSLQTFLAAALLWSAGRMLRRARVTDFLVTGVILAVMTVNRATAILIAPFLFTLYLARKDRVVSAVKAAAMLAVPIVVAVMPFAWHNLSAEGVFLPVTSSGGYNFYAGNNAGAAGMYHVPEGIDLYGDPNGKAFAQRQTGRALNSAEVSAFWSAKAWRWIGEHPGDFVALLGKKALMFVYPGEYDQMGLDAVFVTTEYGTVLASLVIGFPVVFILALCGLVATRRAKVSPAVPLVIILGVLLGSLAFFVNGRIRLAAIPPMVALAGFAVDHCIGVFQTGKWRNAVPLAAAAVAGALVLFVQPRIRSTWDQEYVRLGQIAFDARDVAGAEALFRKSVQQKPTVQGLTNLANACAAQGKAADAERAYADAMRLDPSWPLLHFNLGNFRYARGDAEQAMSQWLRATALQPDLAPAWRNLGLASYRAGRWRQAVEYLVKARQFETDANIIASIDRDLGALREMTAARADSIASRGGK